MTTSTKRQARADAYVTVPCRIADEPQTQAVYNSDHLLAAYVRAFIMADRAYPSHLPVALLPKRDREALLAAGLLDVPEPGRYTIPGLDAKRTAASAHASHAAGVQWRAAKPAQKSARSDARSIHPSDARSDAQGDAQMMPEGMPTETETETLPTFPDPSPPKPSPEPAGKAGTASKEPTWNDTQGDEWAPLRPKALTAWRGRFKYPPTEAQRVLLVSIAKSDPDDLADWIRDAPGGSFEVVAYAQDGASEAKERRQAVDTARNEAAKTARAKDAAERRRQNREQPTNFREAVGWTAPVQ